VRSNLRALNDGSILHCCYTCVLVTHFVKVFICILLTPKHFGHCCHRLQSPVIPSTVHNSALWQQVQQLIRPSSKPRTPDFITILKKVHILRFVALWLFINFHHIELDCTGNHLGKRQQEDPRVDGSMESSKIWKCSRWRIGRIWLEIERSGISL
jgi:hypothetical protein